MKLQCFNFFKELGHKIQIQLASQQKTDFVRMLQIIARGLGVI